MAKIAFIGLGAMGTGMAVRLLESGFDVAVYNRTSAKAKLLEEQGARLATSPADAVANVEAVFVMVADDWASHQVWLGDEGVLQGKPQSDALMIECSTLSAGWVSELSTKVKNAAFAYIDCPVTGLPDAAAAGDLILFCGASIDNLDRARRFLAPLCREIIHFGDIGSGTAYKLIINLMGAVQIAAAAEGLAMAEAAGLDLEKVVDAIASGQAASPQVVRNTRRMAKSMHDKDLIFSGSMRLKDALYGVKFADRVGVKADFGHAAAGCFQELVDIGDGAFNECKVIDVVRQRMNTAH